MGTTRVEFHLNCLKMSDFLSEDRGLNLLSVKSCSVLAFCSMLSFILFLAPSNLPTFSLRPATKPDRSRPKWGVEFRGMPRRKKTGYLRGDNKKIIGLFHDFKTYVTLINIVNSEAVTPEPIIILWGKKKQ